MWLGEKPLDDRGKIIELSEYLTRRERRRLASDLEKGRHQAIMNYAPITYLKTLTDFPSNAELAAAGYAGNQAIITTRLRGKDELAIAELSSLEKPDPANPGKMISAFSGAEVLVKMAVVLLKSWTFRDIETGEAYPITEENITGLYQPDFDYLAKEVSAVLESLNPEKAVVAEGEPKTAISEAEKNDSSTSLEVEKEQSESLSTATPA
jgi:hypothetical protein